MDARRKWVPLLACPAVFLTRAACKRKPQTRSIERRQSWNRKAKAAKFTAGQASSGTLAGGFTLVELLVVIAIIGILVALLLPAVQAAREAARRADCVNRMRQIGIACLNHHDSKKQFPMAASEDIETPKVSGGRFTMWGYIPQILPYMEYQNLADLMDLKQHWNRPINVTATRTPLPAFRCPSQGSVEVTYIAPPGGSATEELTSLRTHYMGVMGAKFSCPPPATGYPQATYIMAVTPLPESSGSSRRDTAPPEPRCDDFGGAAANGVICPGCKVGLKKVTDGSSHTFMVGEVSWLCGPQRVWAVGSASYTILESYNYSSKNVAHPLNTAWRADSTQPPSGYFNNDMSFGSTHPGGAHFVMCDASVQFVREDVDLVGVLRPLASRSSGEVIEHAF